VFEDGVIAKRHEREFDGHRLAHRVFLPIPCATCWDLLPDREIVALLKVLGDFSNACFCPIVANANILHQQHTWPWNLLHWHASRGPEIEGQRLLAFLERLETALVDHLCHAKPGAEYNLIGEVEPLVVEDIPIVTLLCRCPQAT